MVHGRETSDEDTCDTAGAGGRCLDNAILLRAERATKNRDVSRILGQQLHDAVSKDRAEHRGAERETSLQACEWVRGLIC